TLAARLTEGHAGRRRLRDRRRQVYGPRVADLIFEHPRLAQIYDALDPDRADLDLYARFVTEVGARTVLDIGCGTGTLACLLAQRGVEVVAVDPARASLDVARPSPTHIACAGSTAMRLLFRRCGRTWPR